MAWSGWDTGQRICSAVTANRVVNHMLRSPSSYIGWQQVWDNTAKFSGKKWIVETTLHCHGQSAQLRWCTVLFKAAVIQLWVWALKCTELTLGLFLTSPALGVCQESLCVSSLCILFLSYSLILLILTMPQRAGITCSCSGWDRLTMRVKR